MQRRRLLVITKEPEFDSRGEVVLGQCEPFTSGWSLIMFEPTGKRETLLVGTYSDLRRVQESCLSIEEPGQVRRRVTDMRTLMLSSVTETIAVHLRRGSDPLDASDTKEMPSIQTDTPRQTPGGLMNLERAEGVVVATVVQPDRADDAGYLKNELLSVLNCHPKAVVMDLGRVPNLSALSFQELAGLGDVLRRSGAGFALCNLNRAMKQKIEGLVTKNAIAVFETQASALAALKE